MRTLILYLLVLFSTTAAAQEITNAGRDFWFGFTEPLDAISLANPVPDTTIVFQVNISSSNTTTGYVEIPGSGFIQTFNVSPGAVSKVIIPDTLAWIPTSEVLENKAIHVHTEEDCVVYSNTYHQFRSEASLVLPNKALGRSYYAMTSEPLSLGFGGSSGPWRSELLIIAPGEEVTVEITPSAPTLGGNAANVPFQVTIDSGQLYQVKGLGLDDMTGTKVECVDPEKRVAVFGGNVWAVVHCGSTADPVYEALFPVESWGQEYILIPTPNVGIDIFRVIAQEDDTDIFKDGFLLTNLDEGEFYQDTHQVPRLITADKPVSVGQILISGNACGNIFAGDPSMVMINPNEQMFLDSITFFAVSEVQIDSNYVSIVTRINDTNTLVLDGVPLSDFNILQGDTNYAWKSVAIDTGSHSLNSNGCGFVAYSIGIGNAESYSYAAGVRLTNLDGGIDYTNISASSDTICQYDTIQFSVQALGNPYLYEWDFGEGTQKNGASPRHAYDSAGTYYPRVIITSLCRVDTVLDTITIIELPQFDIGNDTVICLQDTFRLQSDTTAIAHFWGGGETSEFLTVDSTNTYYVTAFNTRCANTDSIHVEFRPTINSFLISPTDSTDTTCNNEPLRFDGLTDREVAAWLWEFGDGETDTAQSIVRAYAAADNYTVILQATYLCGLDSITDTFQTEVRITQTPEIDLGADTVSCTVPLILKADENDDGYIYTWYPEGERAYEYTIEEDGTYAVIADNNGCFGRDSIQVAFTNEFIIPNVITPNGDGLNDMFRVQATPECHRYNELVIYNRWGQLVFFTNRPLTQGWDGRSPGGSLVEAGTYFYKLSGEDGEENGTITVIFE